MLGLPGTQLDSASAERLERIAPAGVILFARNLDSPQQTIELLAEVGRRLPHPPLFAIDQEGGAVSRIKPWIGATPTAVEFAARGAESATQFGLQTGAALAALGFNVDFAPVVDLCQPDLPNGIGSRSFSAKPATTVEIAGAFLEGLQRAGVAGCLKHFPGLGDTRVDSHKELPTVRRTEEQLIAHDLEPFRQLHRQAASVMVGHGHYVAIDGEHPLPASCSKRVVQGWLRERVGFDGLAVSDDMEMGAVRPLDIDGAAAEMAIDAGLDLLLYCDAPEPAEAAHRRLLRCVEGSEPFSQRIREAAARVARFADDWTIAASSGQRFDEAADQLRRFC